MKRRVQNANDETDASRRGFLAWLWRIPVIAALGSGIFGVLHAYRVHFGKVVPDERPAFVAREPQPVATLDTLAEPWDSEAFTFDSLPAIAFRLPESVPGGLTVGGAHYAAFSRICTHLGCTVAFNKDVEAVAFAFNYRPDTPALVCHCHLSVFLPQRAGLAASGPAVAPLPRVALSVKDDTLWAVGVEEVG